MQWCAALQHDARIPEEAQQLMELAARFDSKLFGELVTRWMTLPQSMRKSLSYSGAVRSRVGDPCHYKCTQRSVAYFDPTNKIYSAALSVMAPQLEMEQNWNAETRGDICESLMGYGYLVCSGQIRNAREVQEVQAISNIVDDFSWWTWRLHTQKRMLQHFLLASSG